MDGINQSDRIRRKRNRARKVAFLRFTTGIRQLAVIHRWKSIFVIAYLLVACGLWLNRGKLLFAFDGASLTIAADWLLLLLSLLGLLCLIAVIGTPRKAQKIQDSLVGAGFNNHSHEPPLHIAKYKHPKNPHITIWEFDSNETHKSKWEDKKTDIEGALLHTIIKVKQSKSGRRIILHTVSPRSALPPILHWKDSYISNESFELILGESLVGRETVNLAKIPHILLGGSSGSGKSVLLKLLLMQCLKRAQKYISQILKVEWIFPMCGIKIAVCALMKRTYLNC